MPPSTPLANAAQWIEQALLGQVATLIAIVAVAIVGLMMLSGRIDLRHGARVIAGCFLLFGASSIAAGLQSAVADTPIAVSPPIAAASTSLPPPVVQVPVADPYAGASVHAGESIF